jgi:DNA-binding beta-propeller fold protein YncE
MSRKFFVLFWLTIASLSGLAVLAQDEEPLASGLVGPRQITYASDGTLFIVEAGSGGDVEAEGAFGPVTVGQTGRLTAVSPEGEQTVLLDNLVSMDGGQRGAMAALVTDDTIWLALGEGPAELPFEDALVMAVVELDRETLETRQVIDVFAAEEAENPDGDITLSNPSDLALAEDGTLYIADASANTVWTWTEEDGLHVFASWSIDDNPVPTTVALAPDGNLYVGFLTGFPFPTEGSRIEVYTPEGELVQTYEGLTMVTDVLVTEDGTVYAVQMADSFGDQGFNPESGSVVTVSEDGIEPVAEGLNIPYGLALSPDGTLVVVVNAFFGAPGSGMVIPLAM